MTKISFSYNNYGVKSSCDQYRNIKGVHYKCWTSDVSTFEHEKKEAKKNGLKYKIINEEFYLEKKHG